MQRHMLALVILAVLQPCAAASCNYTGGFANRSPGPCGSGVPTACEGALDGYANTRCCPSNSRCDISGGNAYCCPDGRDCASQVVDAPKCADDSSNLWHFEDTLPADSWCCDEAHLGVAVFNSKGVFLAAACAPTDRALAPVTAGYFQAKATRPPWACTGAPPPTTTTTRAATTPTATGGGPPTEASDEPPRQQHASGLGNGSIAGIVVGCVAGVVLVGVASWLVLLLRRTRRARRGAERKDGGGAAAARGQGVEEGPGSYRGPLAELGTAPQQDPAHELGT